MASVAGGGVSNFDGRDRYKLGGRNLTAEESTERVRRACGAPQTPRWQCADAGCACRTLPPQVCYTWQAERFLCTGFMHLLPQGTVIPAEYAKDNS